tara:strand:- start:77 stop:1021 length:945 start_codon:yes stop_codon:yes gene_type:complete
MKYRKLGKSSISVSEIGFGAWGIGGVRNNSFAYGPTEDEESLKALHYAKEHGVNFFDSAPLYGYGHSEELLGEAFNHCRQEVIISTKVGFKDFSGNQDFSKNYISESINFSLKRMRTDYVDAFLLHSPPINQLKNDDLIFENLIDLKEKGKTRLIGISAKSPEDCLEAIKLYPFDLVQVNFNLIDQRMLRIGLLEHCNKNGIGIVGRTPLCFGFLTGKFTQKSEFDTNDHRANLDKKLLQNWTEELEKFMKLTSHKYSGIELALNFCLSYEISTTIPGMINLSHIKENISSVKQGYVNHKDLKNIEILYDNLNN